MRRTPILTSTLTAIPLALGLLAAPALAQNAEGPTTDPNQVRPGAYVLDPAHGKITWSLSHLGYSTYFGQITDVTGEATLDPKEPAKSRLSVTIRTDSVSGLNPKLDQHLKTPDFFDTRQFPTATFRATSVEPTGPTTARVVGDLTLKGVTKSAAFDATFNQAGISPVDKQYTVGFDGRAVIKRSDFGISAFLPILGDEVTLRLEGEFKAAP
ncbi:YceI family protein [Methylobacterium gregans]|uniref:Protein YceI n=1 Tax=Methylobacterium gregans TaxID=374424 RepID=A0AA37HKR8_9HYPH|nr:YceI family protein [Methylobacterium gregans]MDQ0519973.1 polyisoprenoid-binding protein YceI [Methylobacterium gregans]GJD77517.1 Protein YceI [Methylobacterium gregans]GLS53907.1 polyisoprenoid-binding protein [Methylobacterium gregans]